MKRLLIFLIATSISTASIAKEREPSDLEMILEAMTKAYIESALKDIPTKKLEEYIVQTYGDQYAGSIARVFALVGFVEGVQSYEKASTESQRYQAASRAFANAISLAVPAVGGVVQLGVLAQDLAAAWVSKDFQLKQAQLIAQITALDKQSSELRLREFEAEKAFYVKLIARGQALEKLVMPSWGRLREVCSEHDGEIQNPRQCLSQVRRYQEILHKQINVTYKILRFQGRFISTSELMGEEKVLSLQKTLKSAQSSYNESIVETKNIVSEISLSALMQIRGQVDSTILVFRCETLFIEALKNILNMKKQMHQSPEERDWLTYALEDRLQDLDFLANGTCNSKLITIDADLRILANEALAGKYTTQR